MKGPIYTLPPEPQMSVSWCPICGIEIHRESWSDWRPIEKEGRAREHYRNHHRLRFRLWERFGWNWLLGVWR